MVDHRCTVVLILSPLVVVLFCCYSVVVLLLFSFSALFFCSPFSRVLVERLKRRYDLLTMLQAFNVLKQLVYIKYTKYYGAVRMLERKNYQTLRLSMGTTNHSR